MEGERPTVGRRHRRTHRQLCVEMLLLYASSEQFSSLVKHFVSKKHMTAAAGGADLPGMRLVVDRLLKLGGSQMDLERIGRMAARMGLQRRSHRR